MEGYEIYKEVENSIKGFERLLRLTEYLPSEIAVETGKIINLGTSLVKILKKTYDEAEEIKRRAQKEGFETGKEEGQRNFLNAAETLIHNAEKLRDRETKNLETLFERFIKKLSQHLSHKNTDFIQEYISKYIEKISAQKTRILVSQNVYNKIATHLPLTEKAEIIPDSSLSDEQIFIEADGILSDAGIDRYFEEISH
ncbi:MAG: hypothetical protein N3B13_06265 [Deltaproteobacteria bacterium]|nr:hypothetical protein [Deltaproteobacteria bacterium]